MNTPSDFFAAMIEVQYFLEGINLPEAPNSV